jgi:hypothetical protein
MGPGFPYPEDEGGDVKNLIGSPGYYDPVTRKLCNNDSIWMDLGFPVMVAPNGRKFKPLFAPLITDLDNRINVNVHGNIRGQDTATGKWLHLSNQGWGPWEVALNQIINGDPDKTEWSNLLTGTRGSIHSADYGYALAGRYGYPPSIKPKLPTTYNPLYVLNDPTLPGKRSRFYSQVDYDGANFARNGPSAPMKLLTQQQGATIFTSFPTYNADPSKPDYGNSSLTELTDHPLLYNYFQPALDNSTFPVSNMEALLRYLDTGSPALTSDLFRLLPASLDPMRSVNGNGVPDPSVAAKIRNLLTTHSFDLDRPGVRPWIWQDGTSAPYQQRAYPAVPFYPTGGAIKFPPGPVGTGEFGTDSRASYAEIGRIDLNRRLPEYPKPGPDGRFRQSDLPLVALAQQARTQFAKEIFDRLRWVTTGTAQDLNVLLPTLGIASTGPRKAQFDALRWLAQLAVNIVDYIDSDDYMTQLKWYTEPGSPPKQHWVFGTELPRLVVNEAYVEVDNDPSDQGTTASRPPKANFWVELHNPLNPDPALPDPIDATASSAARLKIPGQQAGIYRLVIAESSNQSPVRNPENNLGTPDPAKIRLSVSDFTDNQNDPPALQLVLPLPQNNYDANQIPGNIARNIGFYVLGPKVDFPNDPSQPNPAPPQATLRVASTTNPTNSMTFDFGTIGVQSPDQNFVTAVLPQLKYDFFLQRLACPYLPLDETDTSPTYNPYITIDYMEKIPANDGIKSLSQGQPPHQPAQFKDRHSWGRKQPYAARWAAGLGQSQIVSQTPQNKPPNQPQHTFFRHNAVETMPPVSQINTLSVPFNWLQHADRPLISPMELLSVSMFKPHELTQQFVPNFGHCAAAAFLDQKSRLYRVFEFLETGSRAQGMARQGRVPGRININTIWDGETLLALCDPQPSNNNLFNALTVYNPAKPYDAGTPGTLFGKMISLRTPNLSAGALTANDRPFLGMAAPYSVNDEIQYPGVQYPGGIGINDTFLRMTNPTSATPSPPVFAVPGTSHPAQQFELMTKIFNQITTRSNVFAVWVTVGFFEVTDDTTRPVKLGAEIGRAENRHTRHRLFAIVDRTNITESGDPPIFISGDPLSAYIPGDSTTPVSIAIPTGTMVGQAITGTYEGHPWSLQPGESVYVDFGPLQEQVAIPPNGIKPGIAGNPPTITLTFSKPHTGPLTIYPQNVFLGNPGPQLHYDPRQDSAVVRYLSIIE